MHGVNSVKFIENVTHKPSQTAENLCGREREEGGCWGVEMWGTLVSLCFEGCVR
jgi:hypothetical protein